MRIIPRAACIEQLSIYLYSTYMSEKSIAEGYLTTERAYGDDLNRERTVEYTQMYEQGYKAGRTFLDNLQSNPALRGKRYLPSDGEVADAFRRFSQEYRARYELDPDADTKQGFVHGFIDACLEGYSQSDSVRPWEGISNRIDKKLKAG